MKKLDKISEMNDEYLSEIVAFGFTGLVSPIAAMIFPPLGVGVLAPFVSIAYMFDMVYQSVLILFA